MTVPRSSARQRRVTRTLPAHIAGWELPPGWRWGAEGILGDFRHYQEVIDGLGRSLSLVTAPDPSHHRWLHAEAIRLAHLSHQSIPTTYHYWTTQRDRGPGYLRRWVAGETVAVHFERQGAADVPYALRILRDAGGTLSYLHTSGAVHGALTADTVWTTPTGRLWMLEWQWATAREEIPPGLQPTFEPGPLPPEWGDGGWMPTPESDQWQLAAICFAILTGETLQPFDIPPVKLLRPETPDSVAIAIDRALNPDPRERFQSMAALIRAAEGGYRGDERRTRERATIVVPDDENERVVRDAVGYDYEILARLGSGTFGTVWRARDLSLEREVALKVLHPHIARDADAVSAFWREARLAAQLAHPAIVPIYDWDGRAGLTWYTMELAEGGSVAQLIARRGARTLDDIAMQVEQLLDGLSAAHAIGVVHRDLKPENVLIDRYSRWRLTDFGIANVPGEERPPSAGTLGFSAPEQLLGEPQGPAVDCFALAAVVVFVLNGAAPFVGNDPQGVLAQQLGERAPLEALPPAIAEWARRGLAPRPSDRFADAHEMQREWRVAVEQTRRRGLAWGWWRRLVSGGGR